ncbi:CHAD domain-containing protein [Nitrosomonas sp.]|uniref:CHAD domain-containing protein n=1 Tax=Nitrosomonas sp. TaxID=42353 RepID=UPI0025DC6B19|nr:CHAD domain-containing protein [Nitrosomonas sp.]
MHNDSVQFVFKQKTDMDAVFDLLCREYSLHETFHQQLKRHYLDSFDWRMYQKNTICGWDVPDSKNSQKSRNNQNIKNREGVFFIRNKDTGSSLYEFPFDHIPKFSKDISHQTCRQMLDGILGIRAFMTVVTMTVQRRQLLVLNKENKTLAILQAERYTINGHADEEQLHDRLIVFPIRGYKRVFKQVLQYITEHLKLPCAGNTVLDEALAATGQKPDTNAFTLKQKLSDSLNTWEAAQILLRHLLNVMQANEPGLRDAIDTEFLHDYRVAVRRTRSILGQIKHIFPGKLLDYFKREFYWLGAITTPARDLDMYLLKFEGYMRGLPPDLQSNLAPFRLFLERHWKVEHTRLCQALDSKRYQKLISQWQQTLASKDMQSQSDAVSSQQTSPQETFNATKPARQVVSQRIEKLYKRVLKEGRAITQESHDETLHELRKTCKKLRYLIEFFHDYYPDKQIKRLIKTLKMLQENLGDFQDLCVQVNQLNCFAEQMRQEGLADTKTIMAMGVLVQKLTVRKAAVRTEFSQRFKAFIQADKGAALMHAWSHQRSSA